MFDYYNNSFWKYILYIVVSVGLLFLGIKFYNNNKSSASDISAYVKMETFEKKVSQNNSLLEENIPIKKGAIVPIEYVRVTLCRIAEKLKKKLIFVGQEDKNLIAVENKGYYWTEDERLIAFHDSKLEELSIPYIKSKIIYFNNGVENLDKKMYTLNFINNFPLLEEENTIEIVSSMEELRTLYENNATILLPEFLAKQFPNFNPKSTKLLSTNVFACFCFTFSKEATEEFKKDFNKALKEFYGSVEKYTKI